MIYDHLKISKMSAVSTIIKYEFDISKNMIDFDKIKIMSKNLQLNTIIFFEKKNMYCISYLFFYYFNRQI